MGAVRLLLALQAMLVVGPSTENGRLQTETASLHPQGFRTFEGGQAPYLSNNDVYEVSFTEGGEALRGTGLHPLYSLDRDDWVSVRDLQVGERLQTAEGAVTVEALEKVRGVHRVYNLEVEGDHEYLVGEAGVRAHNSCVQNRINIANGRTRFTPLRNTGEPVSAGFEHVLQGHFNRAVANNRSVFSITPERLKGILGRADVVSSPVTDIGGGQWARTVNVGEVIGNASLRQGGGPTTWLRVISDRAGNLITTYPVGAP